MCASTKPALSGRFAADLQEARAAGRMNAHWNVAAACRSTLLPRLCVT